MKKAAQIGTLICTFLCVAPMHAYRISAINAATVPVYVALFSMNGNTITDVTTRPVYKLPRSGKNRTIKPYASFDFNINENQKFVFSAHLQDIRQLLETAQVPTDTIFSTIFTYEPEEDTTFFEIQRDRLSNDETITQKLVMKPLGSKTHLSGVHTKEEINLSARKDFERFKKEQARADQLRDQEEQELAQEPRTRKKLDEQKRRVKIHFVEQRGAQANPDHQEYRGVYDDQAGDNEVRLHM